jgi:hypothetical protein
VDTRNGDILHWIRFDGAVRELLDATFIPGVRAPMCVGLASPEFRTLITLPADEAAPLIPEYRRLTENRATQAWGWDLDAVIIMLIAAFPPLNEP